MVHGASLQYESCRYISTQILDVWKASIYVLPQQNNVVDLPDGSPKMMQHLGVRRHQCKAMLVSPMRLKMLPP